jgi:tripartite-type tricarboxylate transporter receptor subunit TctC
MSTMARRSVLGGLLAVSAGARARADEWPLRPVVWLVPFPAGGGSDAFARPIAARVSDLLGQPMVIDNKSGAGGMLGTAIAARAPADGYTLLVGDTALTYAPVIQPRAGFVFDRDFAPISAFARVPYALIVNPARLDVASLASFIEAAKRKPGSINVGSAGVGTMTHLAIGLFEARAGVQLNHVPYRGGAPMLQDLLAGQIEAAFVLVSAVADQVKAGKLRGLAVANRRREALLPDVPTMQEAGLPDLRITTWFGLFAPRRTPNAILDRLHGAVQEVLGSEAIKRQWLAMGARVEPESRAEFASFIARETDRWSRIARAANIQTE